MPSPHTVSASVSSPTAPPASVGLHEWPMHQPAEVVGFADAPSEAEAQTLLRLLEVGFLPGERVCLMASGLPGRDPLAVRVGHSTFALRRHEAALVRVTAPAAAALAGAGARP